MKKSITYVAAFVMAVSAVFSQTRAFAGTVKTDVPITVSTPEPTPATKSSLRLPSVFTFTATPTPAPTPGEDGVKRVGDCELKLTNPCLTSYEDYENIFYFTLEIKNVGRKTMNTIPLLIFGIQDGMLLDGGTSSDDAPLKAGESAVYNFIYLAEPNIDIIISVEREDDQNDSAMWDFKYKSISRKDIDLSEFFENDENEPSVYYAGNKYDGETVFDALEAYVFGDDRITAVTAVVGARYCADWAYGTYTNGGEYFEMYYESDSTAEDMEAYVYFLMDDEGFFIMDNDIEFNKTGEGVMAKPASDKGMLLYIELNWDEESFYLCVSHLTGELTFFDDLEPYYILGQELPDDADAGELMGFWFGEDEVPSLGSLVGYRECSYWGEGAFEDDMGFYIEMICGSDDPADDADAYFNYLMEDWDFINLYEGQDNDGEGERLLVKPSYETGIVITVEINWDDTDIYISVSKFKDDFFSGTEETDKGNSVVSTPEEVEKVLTNYLIDVKYAYMAEGGEMEVIYISEGRCDEGCYISYESADENVIVYVDFNDLKLYALTPVTMEGLYIDITKDDLKEYQGFSDLMKELLFLTDGYESSGMTLIGTERVGTRKTDVYEDSWSATQYKYWIDQEYGIILRYWEQVDDMEYTFVTTRFLDGDVEASDLVNLKDYKIEKLVE